MSGCVLSPHRGSSPTPAPSAHSGAFPLPPRPVCRAASLCCRSREPAVRSAPTRLCCRPSCSGGWVCFLSAEAVLVPSDVCGRRCCASLSHAAVRKSRCSVCKWCCCERAGHPDARVPRVHATEPLRLAHWFSGDYPAPRRCWATSGGICGCHDWGAPGLVWVEATDAAHRPAVPRTPHRERSGSESRGVCLTGEVLGPGREHLVHSC